MKTLTRCTAAAILAFGLTAPLMTAQEHTTNKRYYDKAHKDYHEWNSDEDQSYTKFRGERHIPEHTFAKARPTEQAQYWKWRHEHPDEKR